MSASLIDNQTWTADLYRCPACGVIAKAVAEPGWPEFCGGTARCATTLFDEDRVVPGRVVYLHHAKSADRKFGYVAKVGRSRMQVIVKLVNGEWGFRTERSIADPDIRWTNSMLDLATGEFISSAQ